MSQLRRGELFRIPSKGKVAGVCAGLADYFGWEPWLVRILVVSGVLLGMGWFVVIYIAAWFILDKKPMAKKSVHANMHSNNEQANHAASNKEDDVTERSIKVKAKVWQSGEPPKQAFYDIRHKFSSLEQELRSIEKYVTSPEFTVAREINKL